MKKYRKIICLLLLLVNATVVNAIDMDKLYDRFWNLSKNNPEASGVASSLALLKADGSFSDLNYSSTGSLDVHLTRLKSFAGAYQSAGNVYYRNESLKSQFYKSLQFWITKDHRPSNWWFRHIGYPKAFAPCLFLMNVEMRTEKPTLFNDAVKYLRWAYLQNNYMEGANGADKIYGAFPASVLTKDENQLKEYQDKIKKLVAVQNMGEGIEPDWMYGQHSGNGRQVYANYEHEFLNSILLLLDICKETVYSVSDKELSVLDDHFINGNQWYVYNKHMDPCQTGRKPTAALNGRFPNTLKLLVGLNTPKNSEIAIVQDRILNGKNASSKLTGNRMFWRFDYMIHRRENYYVSSRLTSTRTVGMESGNGEGIYNYYSSAGLNFLFRTGNEYDKPFFTDMNFRQWPGITVEQDNAALPLVDWGKGSSNGNDFAGGVSDGNYGAIGTIYSKKNVTAFKSWFYFDDEFVALGCGITKSAGNAPLFTTINQALQKSSITYSKGNNQQTMQTASGTISVSNPDWVLQDSIGYINLQSSSNFKISSDKRNGTNFFTVGIEHGINPVNETYAYLVYPNTSAVSIQSYKANLPIQILSNSNTIQAVYHTSLKITQAIFYTAGNLTLANGKILSVNAPAAVTIKENDSSYQVSVGNPLCESSNPVSLELTMDAKLSGSNITWNGTKSTINIALPQGDYAGQSVSIIASKDENATGASNIEDAKETVNIYPNPVDKTLTISAGERKISAVRIYGINGQIVFFQQINNKAFSCVDIDFSEFNKGQYLIELLTDRGKRLKKITKL